MTWKKPTTLEILFVVAILFVLIAVLMPSIGDHDRTHKYPATVVPGIYLVEVAGDYHQYYGRGPGLDLSILPDGRYSFIYSGCTGVCYRESGQVREVNNHLELSPDKPNTTKINKISGELVGVRRILTPVRWGERAYLIPSSRLHDFCDAVIVDSDLVNSSSDRFFLKNPSGPVDGFPDVPEGWLAYLQTRLVLGKMIEVSQSGMAKVSLGSKDGLKINDMLKVAGGGSRGELQVTIVEDDSSLVIVRHPGAIGDMIKPGRTVFFARPDAVKPEQ